MNRHTSWQRTVAIVGVVLVLSVEGEQVARGLGALDGVCVHAARVSG